MIMVVHQDIGMNQDTIAIMVILLETKKLYPVLCIKKDFSPLISTAGNMIQGSRIFNPNSSSHSLYISYSQRYVKFQGLTPMIYMDVPRISLPRIPQRILGRMPLEIDFGQQASRFNPEYSPWRLISKRLDGFMNLVNHPRQKLCPN